jgi:hypothetical protein
MLTPERYAIAVEKALSTPKYSAKIRDLFVVPDYISFFHGCLDKLFGNYCKKDGTQLQFVFEAIAVCGNFPLGVKTTYKAYSAEQVVEIKEIINPTLIAQQQTGDEGRRAAVEVVMKN